ncbi:MAG: tetratricopeptide repeat protein [Capsulimonadaceae bacterium]
MRSIFAVLIVMLALYPAAARADEVSDMTNRLVNPPTSLSAPDDGQDANAAPAPAPAPAPPPAPKPTLADTNPAAAKYLDYGTYLTSHQRFADAVPFLREAAKLAAGDSGVHADLAEALARTGQLDEAVKEAQSATDLDPTNADAYRVYAEVLNAAGRPHDAAAAEENAIRDRQDDPDLNALLGRYLVNAQDARDAVPQLKYALHIYPNLTAAYETLGEAYLQLGSPAAAVLSLRSALHLVPGFALAHLNLGVALYRTGDRASAAAEWREALHLGDPRVAAQASTYIATLH